MAPIRLQLSDLMLDWVCAFTCFELAPLLRRPARPAAAGNKLSRANSERLRHQLPPLM